MTRLFSTDPIKPGEGSYTLDEAESRYLRDVLRMRAGDGITLCDANRTEYEGVISDPSSKRIKIILKSGSPNESEPPYRAILCQGLPKGDKMSSVIQKAVELGVFEILPVTCSRSVSRIDPRDAPEKVARWQKVSLEAARQSGRGLVPQVRLPMSFRETVDEICRSSDLVLIPWEEANGFSIADALEPFSKSTGTGRISVLIGPEGGFEKSEVEYAVQHGAIAVTLGKRILRTETAGPSVLAMLLYRLELS